MDPTNPSTSSNSTSIYTNPALDPNDPDIFYNDNPNDIAATNVVHKRRRVPTTTEEVKALLDFEGPTVDTPMPLLEEYKKERARKRADEDALEAEELKAKMANAPTDQVELEPAAMDSPIPEDAAMFAFNALTMLTAQLPQPTPIPAFNSNFQQGNLFFLDLRTSDLSGFNYQLLNFGNIGIFNPNVNIFNFATPPQAFSMQSDVLGNLNVNIREQNGQEARGSEGPSSGAPSEHLTHSDTLDEMQASRPTTVNTMFSALTSPMVSPGLDGPASHYGTLPIQMFLPTQMNPIVPQLIPEASIASLPVHTAQEPVLIPEAQVVAPSTLPMQHTSSSNDQIVPEPVVTPPEAIFVNQTTGKKYITTSGTWHIPKDPAAETSTSGSSVNGSEKQIKVPAAVTSPIVVSKSPDAPESARTSGSSSAGPVASGRKESSEDPVAVASSKPTEKHTVIAKSPDVPETAGTSSSSSSGSSANGSAIRNEDPAVAVSPIVVLKSPDTLEAAGTSGCSPAGPIASGNQRSSEDPVVAVSLMTITTKKQNIVVLKSHDAPEAARTSDSSPSGSSFNGSEKHFKDSAAAASTKKANVVLKSPVTPEAARISSSFSSDSITSGKNRSSEDLAATAPPKTVTTKKPTMVLKSPDVPEAARTSASSSAGPIAFGKKRSSDDPIATTSTPKNVRFTDFPPRPPPPLPPPRYHSEVVFQMAPKPSAALSSRAQSSSSIPSQLFDRRHETTHVGTPAPKTPITSQGYHLPATRIVPMRQETPMEPPRSRTGSSASKPKVMKILTSGPEFEKMKAEFLEYSESNEYKKAMGYLQVFNCLIDASNPIDRFPKSVSNVPGINRLREWAQGSGNAIPDWRVRDRRNRIVKVQDHMIKMNWVIVKTVVEQKQEEKEKPKKEKPKKEPVKKEKRGQKRSAARIPTFAENAQAHNNLRRRLNDREAATSSGMFSPTSSFIR